jgi:dienelactone hydrolase
VRAIRGVLALACLALLAAAPARAAESSLVTIKTPRGVKQPFILIKPEKPIASVMLFAGGVGALHLQSATTMKWGRLNFLVRVRDKLAARNLMVAVVDTPSDKPKGLFATFRITETHAQDVGAVAAYLKQQADVPVWAVGTSMGTFSAASGALHARNVDGLVLTATITRSRPEWPLAASHPYGVVNMPLSRFKGPALVMSHVKDGCQSSPAADAEKLRKALANARPLEVVLLDGGQSRDPNPCEAMAHHGFQGIEDQAVDAIAKFIAAHSRRS